MPESPTGPDRFHVAPTAESHFSWLRTRLSIERTLMSWIRTSTALIGFGFTIVQFFDKLHEISTVAPALRPETSRFFGLTLILSGVLALAISTWQYHRLANYLWSQPFTPLAGVARDPKKTPLLAVAIALILIGLYAFFAVFLRLR